MDPDEMLSRILGDRRRYTWAAWLEMVREAVTDTRLQLALRDVGFPMDPPAATWHPRRALAYAYVLSGIEEGEVEAWEGRRLAGEDVEQELRMLAALRDTPWDDSCALPPVDERTDEEIAADEWAARQRLHAMLGYKAVPVAEDPGTAT